MTRTTWIYGLQDPRDGKVYYVGASIDPYTRWRQHIALHDTADKTPDTFTAKQRWLTELVDEEIEPNLVLFEEVEGIGYAQGDVCQPAKAAEREWMRRLHKKGHPLTNGNLLAAVTEDPKPRVLAEAIERGKQIVEEAAS